ncbi:Inner membrane transport protein YajR [Candidatus Erwinia haradaeae]|uniref:Inner membrane transport protein YajR n=1 Tax=Candidatus Erwinia haradaeae TaxID=1922217 RepID=A0A451DL70_9GAMM|nr:MFS transporter [Candidatus Erwinia haradaeae]VFP87465.1 Inner membrane transport protein YajR [Candidatus Erwinia haradaeae]
MAHNKMTPLEKYASWGLGTVFSLRMLGLFMALPILTTYGGNLNGATETLTGLAIGIYGITQAFFQIPFGVLSDRFGRKPLIISGLSIFMIGSIIAAMTESIWGVILGRALQGVGAIAGTILALLSDLMSEENYTKAITFLGISFGITFSLAIVLGPIITQALGLQELFWIIAVLTMISIIITLIIVPSTSKHTLNRESSLVTSSIRHVIGNSHLMKLNLSVFFLHVLLMSSFIGVPKHFIMVGLSAGEHWKIYLCTMSIALALAAPLLIYAEKKRQMKKVFVLAIGCILGAETVFWMIDYPIWTLITSLEIFFVSFNLIEAILPSFISKQSPVGYKGTAMGVYTTSQCIGVATGGFVGGWILDYMGSSTVFLFNMLVALSWFVLSLNLREPRYLSTLRFHLEDCIQDPIQLQNFLKQQDGIFDAWILPHEKSAYVKIDSKMTNRDEIKKIMSQKV